jgi:hypothetical protein
VVRRIVLALPPAYLAVHVRLEQDMLTEAPQLLDMYMDLARQLVERGIPR